MRNLILHEFLHHYDMNTCLDIEEITQFFSINNAINIPTELIEYFTFFNGSKQPIGMAMWNFWKLEDCYILVIKNRKLLCFCDALLEAPIYGIQINGHEQMFGRIYDVTYECETGYSLLDFLQVMLNNVDSVIL